MYLVAVLLLGVAAHAIPVKLPNPGPPPDVIGVYTSKYFIGANAADGSFTYQGADNKTNSEAGVYLSYECIGGGTGWNAVYSQYTYGADGNFTTTSYCEKGSVLDGLYTSTYAATEACPLTPSLSSSAETHYHIQVPGSSLGALLNAPFCTASRKGVLVHPINNSPPANGL